MIKPKHIHFVGIKGVGMTPLAIIAKEADITVSGSDIDETFITDATLAEKVITPEVGFSEDHIREDVDLVIATGAHGGLDNIEVQEAKRRGISVIMKGQAVGEYMEGSILGRTFKGISVAGSHGKTTTSAMIATILTNTGSSPSFIVGTSSIVPLGASGKLGKGEYFVAEADEYATDPKHDLTPQFLWQHPKIAVYTNIELDHPDIYADVSAVARAFIEFTKRIMQDGVLIACGDNAEVQRVLTAYHGRFITYGEGDRNEYQIADVKADANGVRFAVLHEGEHLVTLSLSVYGRHNALNGLAAFLVAKETGLDDVEIGKGLLTYEGAKRRLERVGVLEGGAVLYDDYAHHPTEIRKTLLALREHFPDKKIVCVFQPHTYSRTKKLLEDFTHSLSDADTVLLAPIYASLREQKDISVSSHQIAYQLVATGRDAKTFLDFAEIACFIEGQKYDENTVIVTMGAGDIYKIREMLPLVG